MATEKITSLKTETQNYNAEAKDAIENEQTNNRRGASVIKPIMLMQTPKNEIEQSPEDKAELLSKFLSDATIEPDAFESVPGYTENEIKADNRYVKERKESFDKELEKMSEEDKRRRKLSKIAEEIVALYGISLELIPFSDEIDTIEHIGTSEYDDIANGADDAIIFYLKTKEQIPLVFDVTIGQDEKTIIKKLFRGKKDSHGIPTQSLGQTSLRYSEEISENIDENGYLEYDRTKRRYNSVPRITLAFSEDEVINMLEKIQGLNQTNDQGEIDPNEVYPHMNYEQVLIITQQIIEQSEFYILQAQIESEEIKELSEEDAEKKKEINELISKYQKLKEVLNISSRYAYIQCRKKLITDKKAQKVPNIDDLSRIMTPFSLKGTAAGALIDRVQYYEGYNDSDFEEEKNETKSLIDRMMKERAQPNNSLIQSELDPGLVGEIEYDAFMKAKASTRNKIKQKRKDRRAEGFDKLEEILQNNQSIV